MKKLLLAFIVLTITGVNGLSQTYYDGNNVPLIHEPDTITTLKDIIAVQQDLINREQYSAHIGNVWKRAGFFNLIYHYPGTMTFTDTGSGTVGANAPKFTAKYGFGIQSGKNHKLHKKPIGNMFAINLDFLPLDLYCNIYKDNNTKLPYGTPEDMDSNGWDYKMFEINYSMSLGPSLTLAPLVPTKIRGLGFFKINAYFHVGYCAALVLLNGTKEKSTVGGLDFGHGLYTSYGATLSWKAIGVGFEHRSGTSKYMSIRDNSSSKNNNLATLDGYKILSAQNRIFINFRF